ncbi:MAG: hypothetical protein ABI707_05595 [Ferruginibacter sp.]
MKQILTTILLLLSQLLSPGQNNATGTLFQTNSKTRLFYVDFKNSQAHVYEIGRYLDKAGTGNSIKSVDTLIQQSNEIYIGKHSKIIEENKKFYLVKEFNKTKNFRIELVKDVEMANNNLNNAYYLDNYFKMSDELNKTYPLNHHSFRNGFYTWKELDNREEDYLMFREFARKRLKKIKDSISNLQDNCVSKTNYIIQNIKAFEYNTLKDSLVKLPAEFSSVSYYYSSVINEVAKQRPEYFFRLAEDFPKNRSLIFMAVEDNKEVVNGLSAVEGHNEIKKEFFKDRRFGKSMPYGIIGTYAVIGGLLAWLILSQK